MKYLIILSISFLVFTNCKKQEANPVVEMHYNYIPTTIGTWNTFEVTEITHTTTGAHDTLNYYLKEVIAELISEQNYRIERFWKTNINDSWTIKDVWTREVTKSMYKQAEENIVFTKLIFPVKPDQFWNGNAFNNKEELEYKYTNTHNSYSINNLDFDESVTIIQQDNTNAIEFQKAEEVYAKDVGLVFKSQIDLSINLFDPTDINDGFELTMKLIDYGN